MSANDETANGSAVAEGLGTSSISVDFTVVGLDGVLMLCELSGT